MTLDPELLKIVGYIFIYPLMAVFVSITIAKWHFEKDTKIQYLAAKDKVANDLNVAITNMLIAMWNLAHIHKMIEKGALNANDPNVINAIQNSLKDVHKNTMDSYPHLGKAGLYFGTHILEKVAQFQSELNNMVSNNNFEVFNNMDAWDNYRREKILPVIQDIHDELKGTVFDSIKSFHLHH